MSEARYKIVFNGEVMPEMALDTVKDNLARLFKSDRAKIDNLFSGSAVALKRDLPESEADKYLTALQRAGAKAVALDVLRHRVLLSFEAEAEGVSSDAVIQSLIECVPLP